MERYLDLWPLALVVLLAGVFKRLGQKPKRHGVGSGGDHAHGSGADGGGGGGND